MRAVSCCTAAFLAIAAGSALGAPKAAVACRAGLIDYGGAKARVYCGLAKATARLGATVIKVANGECSNTAVAVIVNVGAIVIGKTTKPYPSFVGISVGRVPGGPMAKAPPASSDGTYRTGLVSISHRGRGYFARNAVVTVTGGRTEGTFKATTLDGKRVSGSFSC